MTPLKHWTSPSKSKLSDPPQQIFVSIFDLPLLPHLGGRCIQCWLISKRAPNMKSDIHFCYIFVMFLNEKESDKFWLIRKCQVHFQALVIAFNLFSMVANRLSHCEYLVHWKSKYMNGHEGHPFPEIQYVKHGMDWYYNTTSS